MLGWAALLASCVMHPVPAASVAPDPVHTSATVEKEETSTLQPASWSARLEKELLTAEGELSLKGWVLFGGAALCCGAVIKYPGILKDPPLLQWVLSTCCSKVFPIFLFYSLIFSYNRLVAKVLSFPALRAGKGLFSDFFNRSNRWVAKKRTPIKKALIGDGSSFAFGWWQDWVVAAVCAGAFYSVCMKEQIDHISGLKLQGFGARAAHWGTMSVIAPICEEIICRGLLFAVFSEHGMPLLLNSLLSSLIYQKVRGWKLITKFGVLKCISSFVWCTFRHKSGSVRPAMICRITFTGLMQIYLLWGR